MRIRATCDTCGRDFLFSQLYNADPWHTDKCPHCHAHLGVTNLRHLAHAADRALAGLVNVMTQIAERSPGFTLRTESVLSRLDEATAALAPVSDPPSTQDETPSLHRRSRAA